MLCSLGSDFISGFLFVNVGVDLQMSSAIADVPRDKFAHACVSAVTAACTST